MYQMIALYLTIFFEFLLALAFAFVYGESKRTSEYGPIQTKGYKIRKYYFFALVATMGIATILTLDDLPYHSAHAKESATTETKVVEVTGLQYYWEMSEDHFTIGDQVEFIVTAGDVTHGFGLYTEDLELVAQTQAMPGYENSVYYTFEEPGTYQILCLEYCSVGHHVMIKEIVVEPKGGVENGE
ncbi:cytochrome c oxidase subunit 2 [Mesobacillus persicus]|uniref:Cytochrome aa3 subunit 2 n=1 Tax=Mesobacillus persicus TaxID=930146 RepID=A0A1H8KJE6_9BACI|nr:cytochrome c oxidase subunit II [Mesobacillus persicus]SEN92995.1 cytochrome c oxidase subunit 2 [Mesobacillus persicus]